MGGALVECLNLGLMLPSYGHRDHPSDIDHPGSCPGRVKDSQLIAIDDHDEALEKRLRLPLATTFSRAR